MNGWVEEALYPDWGQRFRLTREIAHEQTAFQNVRIVETVSHGRVLLLDGTVQITDADEFAYQEMIAHVPLLAHGAARRILIIGAGDGGVLRRVLQHSTVERAVMVEIDGGVIQLVRAHMPEIAGSAWDDARAEVIVGDGLDYLARAEAGTFDVIIVDSTDPVGVGEALFTEAFYADCARVLGPRGIVVNQSGVPFMQSDELRQTSLRRAASFERTTAYVVAVPTYVGGLMALGFASQAAGLDRVASTELERRAVEAGIYGQTRYWSPEVHAAAFALPPYIAECLPR